MTSRMALTTTVAQRLVLALLTPLVNWAVTLALMGSLAGDGFIGALLPVPVSAEPEWVRADGSMKDTEEVGGWPTPSKKLNKYISKLVQIHFQIKKNSFQNFDNC